MPGPEPAPRQSRSRRSARSAKYVHGWTHSPKARQPETGRGAVASIKATHFVLLGEQERLGRPGERASTRCSIGTSPRADTLIEEDRCSCNRKQEVWLPPLADLQRPAIDQPDLQSASKRLASSSNGLKRYWRRWTAPSGDQRPSFRRGRIFVKGGYMRRRHSRPSEHDTPIPKAPFASPSIQPMSERRRRVSGPHCCGQASFHRPIKCWPCRTSRIKPTRPTFWR